MLEDMTQTSEDVVKQSSHLGTDIKTQYIQLSILDAATTCTCRHLGRELVIHIATAIPSSSQCPGCTSLQSSAGLSRNLP